MCICSLQTDAPNPRFVHVDEHMNSVSHTQFNETLYIHTGFYDRKLLTKWYWPEYIKESKSKTTVLRHIVQSFNNTHEVIETTHRTAHDMH